MINTDGTMNLSGKNQESRKSPKSRVITPTASDIIVSSLIASSIAFYFFFLNDPAPPEFSPLPLPAAFPLSLAGRAGPAGRPAAQLSPAGALLALPRVPGGARPPPERTIEAGAGDLAANAAAADGAAAV